MDEMEFDKFASEYYDMHARNVAASGEPPEFFHEYKIKDLARYWAPKPKPPASILDFGSGIGNSIPYFRKYFPESAVTCADVSLRCLEISRTRFAGREQYAQIIGDTLPLPDGSFNVVFAACVFHHIDHGEHGHWLRELNRVTKPGGELFIYEHNPLNPFTVAAVRTCPFDDNARLIHGRTFAKRIANERWSNVSLRYRVFFPRVCAGLRPMEPYMYFLPLGAQYCVSGQKAL